MNTTTKEQLRSLVEQRFFLKIAADPSAAPQSASAWKALAVEVLASVLELPEGGSALAALVRANETLQASVDQLQAELADQPIEAVTAAKIETLAQVRASLASFCDTPLSELGKADQLDISGMRRAVAIVDREIATAPTSV